ncbi:MAG: hypothetical protein HY096_15780 [Nitrospinae bacterium]|nr:hypothetical protein [Nitrospinota bacterium]MBI3813718.1 hypothetical protein [Nitrospinota bacterium]
MSSIVIVDSISCLNESNNGDVVVCGSHGSISAAEYVVNRFRLNGIIVNDAGKGKENAGIAGLQVYERIGIPAAAVDTFTAMIGNGLDNYECGIISAVNNLAGDCGVRVGMSAKDAALMMFNRETIKNV